MSNAAFESVWHKIAALEGESFRSDKGVEFTYRFGKTYVVVSSGKQSIPRTFFEKIFQRLQADTVNSSPSLQGQTFILGILADPRLR
jgi:hypothetical protein